MTIDEFRKNAHQTVDWIADYYETIENRPVKSQVSPGDIAKTIPNSPPFDGEEYQDILADVDAKILPGITHWQHPNFHAYFPGNSSFPSILGEMVTSAIASQCMIWETSPAAAELEERVMDWLKQTMSLPSNWHGVIQDTASTGTLVAILSAREKSTKNKSNQNGETKGLRIYCSSQTHSSIDKAVKIAGIGAENLIKIEVDETFGMLASNLEKAILSDKANGFTPCAVISTLGTTGTLAFDPVESISEICQNHDLWHHVDAAYAGSAMILPEYHYLNRGLEQADSFLFNPHKWLFTNFDCTAYFIKDKEALLNTFEILPEYLKTNTRGKVNDYRDWGIQLGRRFRALKLWFVIRSFGINGLQQKLRSHIKLTEWIVEKINNSKDFEISMPSMMNMVVFRLNPSGYSGNLNDLNKRLNDQINQSGEAYLTHTSIKGEYVLRAVFGQTNLGRRHVESLWNLLESTARKILN